jgi:hypothetical protein
MAVFYVEFRACPMVHHDKQTFVLTEADLRRFVCLDRDRAEFTDEAKRERSLGNGSGYVIERIYTEDDEAIIEYYKYGYRTSNTVTAALRDMIKPPKRVVSADAVEQPQ